MVYVKFTSHRSRDYGFRAIASAGLDKPQGFYSWSRNFHPGGCYQLSDEQFKALTASTSRLVRYTKVRGPYTDLLECWFQHAGTTAKQWVVGPHTQRRIL
jgi:hypothetical protein